MRHAGMLVIGFMIGTSVSAWAWAENGRAVIQATADSSTVKGTVTLADASTGLQISVQVAGVPPGKHAIHIHQYGDCTDNGNAAGGHYNPDNVMHGFLPKDGLTKAHPGDLGNLDVGPDGSGSLSLVLPGVMLSGGKYSVGGRAIILHEKVDDLGQPTGNAGSRIGCGPILITKD